MLHLIRSLIGEVWLLPRKTKANIKRPKIDVTSKAVEIFHSVATIPTKIGPTVSPMPIKVSYEPTARPKLSLRK